MYLQTPRLILRNFLDEDLESFFRYRNDPYVARYQGWELPYPHEKAEQFISIMKDKFAPKQGDWIQFAVALKETGGLIGDLACYVKNDDIRQSVIGFTIASQYWRKGFAVEIIPCLLDYLFEDLDMHRVSADCDVENVASYRTLERLGFRREAHFVESFLIHGKYTSEYHYGMLQREWRTKANGG
ncbi:MAG: GNAT family N-acetyltransferase [Chloroflexi bacterium]|nr:GNAT family N-acetyltransferase [Chloroflexota bacterium]